MSGENPPEQAVCARCGSVIDRSDHFVVRAADGAGSAYLCRSEHIVAWVMRGAQWQVERPWELTPAARTADGAVRIERKRAGKVIEREFSSPDELRRWALAGAFWSSD